MEIRARIKRRRLFGSLAPMVPPEDLMFDGPATFEEFHDNGIEFLGIYRDLVGLKPDDAILDVGCGIGRKTVQLTRYLSRNGRYEGFDITKAGIDWCNATIARRHPNFHFRHVDVRSDLYNPAASTTAAEFTFPYDDKSFDVVVLGSVFTHMLPPGVERYTSEVARVLKPGGRSLISYFLLNAGALDAIGSGRSTIDLPYVHDGYRAMDANVPDKVVAHDEGRVRAMYSANGLAITRVELGSWCGRSPALSYQDLIVATA
jgi:SAM-dependent methyltransferase